MEKEWNKIEKEVGQNIIESMPRSVEAVLQKEDIPSISSYNFISKKTGTIMFFN